MINSTSPLQFSAEGAQVLLRLARLGQPICVGCAPWAAPPRRSPWPACSPCSTPSCSSASCDYAQLVMDAEFARMVKFCVPGIPVTDETLSVDVIAEVGPFSDFLSHDDTYKGMRGHSRSTLIDRRVREDWAASGSRSPYDRTLVEARRILETHVPEPLPDEVAAQLKSLIMDAEDDLGVH